MTLRPCAARVREHRMHGLLRCRLAVHCLAERDRAFIANSHLRLPPACWPLDLVAKQVEEWRTRTTGGGRLLPLRQLKRTQVAVAWHF